MHSVSIPQSRFGIHSSPTGHGSPRHGEVTSWPGGIYGIPLGSKNRDKGTQGDEAVETRSQMADDEGCPVI